jgi:hypothetical protein
MTWLEQLEIEGFALIRGALSADEVENAVRQWGEATQRHAGDAAVLASDGNPAYGARNLLDLWPGVVDLVRAEPLRGSLLEVLGSGAGVVRGLYFDKPPGHSWALPWHKDLSLAVREHRPSVLFTKPTVKAGVPHVIAPQAVLDRMLTVRVHLDPMAPDNGPLRVIPGSHRYYDQANDDPRTAVTLNCDPGDVLLMRPLLAHASGHSQAMVQTHRRIVHLECASDEPLGDGFAWKWFVRLG